MKIVDKRLDEIRPYEKNPRRNDDAVDYVANSIREFGWKQPIVIDKDGVIVKGHARYRAAIRLGLDKVPCVITHADEEAKKLDRLADNKVSELSEWVNDDLLHELDMLTTDFDLTALGFPSIGFDDIPDLDMEDLSDEESEEDKRARYQAYLDSHPSEPPKELITTQASIDTAAIKQQNVPEKPKKYFRIVCEKCGHVMFVAEGDAMPISN